VSGVTLTLIFSERASTSVARLLMLLPVRGPHVVGARILESLRKYASHPEALFFVLAASIVVQVMRIVQAYYIGVGLGITAPLATYFAFIPLILLVMLLPVTFNGIGTSQAAFVWFFARAGVAAPPAFALSVLFVALGIVGNLPGALLWIAGRHEAQLLDGQRGKSQAGY
jgi:hypothetical protein